MAELRECPFCEGEIRLDADGFYMFCCDKCGAGVTFAKVFEDGTAGDLDKAESISAWNRRPEPGCRGCIYAPDMPAHQQCHGCARMYRDRYNRDRRAHFMETEEANE